MISESVLFFSLLLKHHKMPLILYSTGPALIMYYDFIVHMFLQDYIILSHGDDPKGTLYKYMYL